MPPVLDFGERTVRVAGRTKRRGLWILLVVIGLAGAGALWFFRFSGPPSGGALLKPDDPVAVARGAEVYEKTCAACHGARLEGQPNWRQRRADGRLPAPPHDQTGHTWHHPDQLLFDLTKFGPAVVAGPDYASDMPAYEESLSDSDIVAVLSYIKSTWPPEIRARHDQLNRPDR